jgi:hypothetical protein
MQELSGNKGGPAQGRYVGPESISGYNVRELPLPRGYVVAFREEEKGEPVSQQPPPPPPPAALFLFSEDGLFDFNAETEVGNTKFDLDTMTRRLFFLASEYEDKNSEEYRAISEAHTARISYLRRFEEYLKLSEYDGAPFVSLGSKLAKPFEDLFKTSDYATYRNRRQRDTVLFDLAWATISKLSLLATYPAVTNDLATSIAELRDNHLMFTFVLRNILSRLAFHTVLNMGIYDSLRNAIEGGSVYSWVPGIDSPFQAFSFVGFNRLLSPNNTAGVSLSSDIDYKLVFDPSVITYTHINRNLNGNDIKKLIGVLQKKQKDLKKKFDKEAAMVLEVEDFTTKDLGFFETGLQEMEAEKNFAASIIYNNVHVTGSPSVYRKFSDILINFSRTPGFILAKSTWIQYLGETDKGSIGVIRFTKELKGIINACAPTLVECLNRDEGWRMLFESKTSKYWKYGTRTPTEDEWKYRYMASPKVFKEALGYIKFCAKEKNDPTFQEALLALFEEPTDLAKEATVGTDIAEDSTARRVLQERRVLQFLKDDLLQNYPEDHPERQEPLQNLRENLRKALLMVPIFKDLKPKPIELLERIAKVVANLVDKDFFVYNRIGGVREMELMYQPGFANYCLQQIGSRLVTPKSSWRFSLKFAGCRLSDFFDSVPSIDLFTEWWISAAQSPTLGASMYVLAKKVAQTLNRFALSMQTAIYICAVNPIDKQPNADVIGDVRFDNPRATHLQIDELYSRITRNQFLDIITRNDVVDLQRIIRNMLAGIEAVRTDLMNFDERSIDENRQNALNLTMTSLQEESNRLMRQMNANEVFEDDGRSFFEAMFNLAATTAKCLDPAALNFS